jgi:hypothetical protein
MEHLLSSSQLHNPYKSPKPKISIIPIPLELITELTGKWIPVCN